MWSLSELNNISGMFCILILFSEDIDPLQHLFVLWVNQFYWENIFFLYKWSVYLFIYVQR